MDKLRVWKDSSLLTDLEVLHHHRILVKASVGGMLDEPLCLLIELLLLMQTIVDSNLVRARDFSQLTKSVPPHLSVVLYLSQLSVLVQIKLSGIYQTLSGALLPCERRRFNQGALFSRKSWTL